METSPEATEEQLAKDEVSFYYLSNILSDLVDQLGSVAERADVPDLKKMLDEEVSSGGFDEDTSAEVDRRISAVVVRTLSGLRQFRRNHDYWERAIAEWAMTQEGITQRDVARHLGIGLSTVNRWAQNPLKPQSTD